MDRDNKEMVKIEGDNWFVYYTQNSPMPSNTIGLIVVDRQNNKWFGTENGLVKFDGQNWVVYNRTNSPLPDNVILSLAMDRNDNLWIGSWEGGLIRFDGLNWTIYNKNNSPLPSNRIRLLAIDSNNVVWIGTESNGVVRYDGNNWQVFDMSNSQLPSNLIYGIAVDKFNHKLIATGDGLAIYREDGVIVEVEDRNRNLPDNYKLYQNYPNPFNSQTKIRFSIPKSTQVSLRVYNALGEEVKTLLSEKYYDAGEYEVEFNASDLPSGIYFYKIIKEYAQTKKMVLIK